MVGLVDVCRIAVEITYLCNIGIWSRSEMKLYVSQTALSWMAHVPPPFIPVQESMNTFNLWLFVV